VPVLHGVRDAILASLRPARGAPGTSPSPRNLEPQHGFPLRLIVPGWYGMTQVKWLSRIDAVSAAFDGYVQARCG
jgi:Oxidoreductase molybdopterin binding domain